MEVHGIRACWGMRVHAPDGFRLVVMADSAALLLGHAGRWRGVT